MSRIVVLPRNMERKLDKLTGLEQEVNGVLFYIEQGGYCPLETLFLTGVGTESHVQSQPERMEIVNEFLKGNPTYQFVKFHTHSKGTIEKFGEYYAQNFSQGDIEGMKRQLEHHRDFIAMLVTPETKLLSGIDNPKLEVVDNFSGYQKKNKAVQSALNVIKRNLGYDSIRP